MTENPKIEDGRETAQAADKLPRKRWTTPRIIISEARSTEAAPLFGPEFQFPHTSYQAS